MEEKKNVALVRAGCNALVRGEERSEIIVTPSADIYETQDSFIVQLDMPGVEKESITLSVDTQTLLVRSAETISEKKNGVFLVNEIGWKKYEREFRLGRGIKLDEIRAEYRDGVLYITLPKTDQIKVRHITIQ